MDTRSPREPLASVYSLEAQPGALLREQVSGALVSNGLAWHASAAGQLTMYWADTDTQTVWAFDCEPHPHRPAALANRRPAVRIPREEGRPDGLCVDTEGMLWVALLQAGAVARYDPRSGAQLRRVTVPGASLVTSVCFGGPALCDLYITTGTWKLTPEALHSEHNAGRLLVVRNAAVGLLPDQFAGE